ncbi:HTTM domain-containing protein [Streptomyces cavernae]|uniref:HTTM domain-containing protein n=1 Tax=Streptomyces cavernae TaxID=2259034 RepID=UPI000FEB7D4D|nr:HTTM domain-containing protein [Streptomyces cavernae]
MIRSDRSLARALARVTDTALGPYQTAVIRIGFAVTWLLFLLREYPHRQDLYGPDGPWSWDMAQQLIAANHAFTALLWFDGRIWFEIGYVLSVVVSALLVLGWRTRTMSVLFMVCVLSLQNRSVFVGDGGDNVIHLMAIYLVFTRCGQVWSLDARRAARSRVTITGPTSPIEPTSTSSPAVPGSPGRREDRAGVVLWWVLALVLAAVTLVGRLDGGVLGGWLTLFWGLLAVHAVWWALGRRAPYGQPRIMLDVIANVVHNAALLVIMAEACLIYATAGWYKIQGTRWQDGTAVYYPLHLDSFSPWPALSDLLSSSGVLVLLVTYGTVLVQVAFPFTLFNRRVKNVLLAVMMTEHAAIAVVLGLPFFSLAMIAADAVFLPTSFLKRLGGWAARARGALLSRVPRRVPGPRRAEEHTPEEAEQSHVGFTA